MKVTTVDIEGLLIIEPDVFIDNRGYFFESFNAKHYHLPYAESFVQDNESKSDKGVLRGMHFQTGDHAQGKLVRVIKGSVYDVAVDLRPHSTTYGKWFGIDLTADNKKQFWVPRGFAHGYLVLEDDTIFSYKCDNFYHKPAENGIRFDDHTLRIKWPDTGSSFLISDKDLALGSLADLGI